MFILSVMLFGKSERFDDNISSQVCNSSKNGFIEESSFSDCTASPVCGVDNRTTGRKTKEIEITSPGIESIVKFNNYSKCFTQLL